MIPQTPFNQFDQVQGRSANVSLRDLEVIRHRFAIQFIVWVMSSVASLAAPRWIRAE